MKLRWLIGGGVVLLAIVAGIWLASARETSFPDFQDDPGWPLDAASPAPTQPSPPPSTASPTDPTNGITLSEDLYPDVDWDDVRARTPGSLVWTETMPADTDAERRRRAEQKARQNRTWGRIQAGLADDDEIIAYFDAKERLLTDNLEFVGILLEDYRRAIPERDQGLLEMALAMTYKRLQKIPEERDRAFAWQAKHADRRRAMGATSP